MSRTQVETTASTDNVESALLQGFDKLSLTDQDATVNTSATVWRSSGTIPSPATVLVDTISLLISCVNELDSATEIAVDLEGVDLCRTGRVCLLQLYAKEATHIWVVDIVLLGIDAFEAHQGTSGKCLRQILERDAVPKLFFDCRNDCDALFHQFQLVPKGVYDVQLQELAQRQNRSTGRHTMFLQGLKKTIELNLRFPSQMLAVKEAGARLFNPTLGGRFEVFAARPLAKALLEYSAADVAVLFKLRDALSAGLRRGDQTRIIRESAKRVLECQKPGYQTHGRQKAEAPIVW